MKPKHITICNELKKLIASGRITQIKIVSKDGKELVCYRLNNTTNEGEKK